MLGKLIKYDLKAMGKTIIPFWAALLISGWLLAIQSRFGKITEVTRMNGLMLIICVAVITAVLVMNVVIVIQRFWKGLLKEEGYLMFTLPVSARNLILSKLVSALLISLGTVIVIILMFIPWILGMSHGISWSDVVELFHSLNINIVKSTTYGVVLLIVEILCSIYHVYAAMAIGQLSNRNRFLFSFVAYVAISIILSILATIGEEFFHLGMSQFEWKYYLIVAIVEIIIYHIVTEYILTKKLNLE